MLNNDEKRLLKRIIREKVYDTLKNEHYFNDTLEKSKSLIIRKDAKNNLGRIYKIRNDLYKLTHKLNLGDLNVRIN